MASLCCSFGGVEVRNERLSLFAPADVTFADAVSPTVLDDFEGKGSWMLLESPLSSARKLKCKLKTCSTIHMHIWVNETYLNNFSEFIARKSLKLCNVFKQYLILKTILKDMRN